MIKATIPDKAENPELHKLVKTSLHFFTLIPSPAENTKKFIVDINLVNFLLKEDKAIKLNHRKLILEEVKAYIIPKKLIS